MILEGAIGDAYGAGFEFADREYITKYNDLTKYVPHPRATERFKKYTDDTQMSIGLVELLISKEKWSRINLAEKFVEVFKRDKRTGYARRFYQLLDEVKDGTELLERLIPKSERNGAAMRAYPIGVIDNINEIKEKCRLQSEITHQTERAVISAEAVALITHCFIYEICTRKYLLEFLSDHQNYKWEGNWNSEVEIDGIQTVEALLTILLGQNDLKSMLRESVNFGGDVDTVASLALAIGSQMKEVENNLPKWLTQDLENGKYGRDYLINLDKEFLKLKK